MTTVIECKVCWNMQTDGSVSYNKLVSNLDLVSFFRVASHACYCTTFAEILYGLQLQQLLETPDIPDNVYWKPFIRKSNFSGLQ